jgi:murein DD-endopeptidase MepM/ murein hydrolase activator NlpD
LEAGYDSNGGNHVLIEYGYKFEDYTYNTGIIGEYLHMEDKPLVNKGEFVTNRTQLGLVGNTGNSGGVHLHYDVYTKPGQTYATEVASRILGQNYKETAMTNKTKTKTVYDPGRFYYSYKNTY